MLLALALALATSAPAVGVISMEGAWLFRAGDDLAWAAVDVDDRA